ncbi:ABC-type bacteriocin/lantibiotic exporter [Paenibacillus popilliae ATCC 14706]|uniref:ABC-type bacteriocin/lantibiotic exporter n=2 Tax=Paenibacillus popilliae TaxID=78057 RepID=M9M350_PAEPP|nr:ABC-type bacteriocin/lantibiotic exporter [Paenibacillus popilliae ATCC 14706]
MENNAQLHSNLVESIQGIEVIKAFGAESKAVVETEKRFMKLLQSVFKFGLVSNVQSSLQGFVSAAGGIVILWAGAEQVIRGNLTMGQLIAFNALLAYFLEPIQNLMQLQSSLQSAVVAAERLGEILDLQPERQESEDKKVFPSSLQGPIHFHSIHFRYGTRKLTLKNIQLSIAPGKKVAFVGESGSGKTTLLKLLMKLYHPESGDVLIDGIHIQDINMDALRRKISFIPQKSVFFSGTIRDNLCLGVSGDIDFDRIIDAAKKAKAHEFINELPLRYHTVLEEDASNLSGGQKQRLAIARALLKNPDILLLDEATSNLDAMTESAISETIFNLQGITTLILAHRLSTVIRCDCIYVMEQGEIVESGNHHELINRKGKYYKLWSGQFMQSECNPNSITMK